MQFYPQLDGGPPQSLVGEESQLLWHITVESTQLVWFLGLGSTQLVGVNRFGCTQFSLVHIKFTTGCPQKNIPKIKVLN